MHPAHSALRILAPCMPVRDRNDARTRARNFRASMNACPTGWRTYFEVLASEMERESG